MWVGPGLVNEGSLPMDPHQQSALYHQFMERLSSAWQYEDEDGDIVTIASVPDLTEACSSCPSHDSVLHLRAKSVQCLPEQNLPLCRRKDLYLSAIWREHIAHEVLSCEMLEQIKRDIPRTWITKYMTRGAQELLEASERVLVAFAHERPEIGYCQGMNSVAVALVLVARSGTQSRPSDFVCLDASQMTESCMADIASSPQGAPGAHPEETEAVSMLCNLVDDVLPPAFWASTTSLNLPSLAAIQAASVVVKQIIETTNLAVAQLLEETLPVATFVVRFLPALFVGVLPLETAMSILDGAFNHGAPFLLVAAAAVVEQALKDLVIEQATDESRPIDAECVYQTVEKYASCCFDVNSLLEACLDREPSIPTVKEWYDEAMLEHIETSWDEVTSTITNGATAEGHQVQAAINIAEAAKNAVFAGVGGLVEPIAMQLGQHVARAADQTQLKHRLLDACCNGSVEDVIECLESAQDKRYLVNLRHRVSFKGFTPLIAAVWTC